MPMATPNPQPKRLDSRQVAAICAAAAMVCVPLTKVSEGSRLAPYRDPANIVTWCYGETHGPYKDRYTDAECVALLKSRLAATYAPKVIECLPELADRSRINVFAAMLDAAYNAGPVAVCLSPMATAIRGDDIKGACSALIAPYTVEGMRTHGWFTTARYRGPAKSMEAMRRAGWTWTGKNWRKEFPGLVTRRIKEAKLCATPVAA